jgi:hypothetical protein
VEACYQHVHLIAGLRWPSRAGVETVMIPPRVLRANVYAERFLLTARTEVTDCMLLFSERQAAVWVYVHGSRMDRAV